jgi:phosphatidylglycerophosphate synthase
MSTKVKTLRDGLQQGIYKVINPFVRLLIGMGLTPNLVTVIGLLLNIGVAIIFVAGAEITNRGDLSYVGWAGAMILFAGLFDMLDGQVARLGNMSSTFGAMFDSVLDRYSELILFLGICYYLIAHHYFLSSLFAFIALIGSMMVSYTRARAEGLGVECKGGLMQRPERVVLISVSAMACGISSHYIGGDYKLFIPGVSFHVFETMTIFTLPIAIMAVMTNITAIGRLRQAKIALDAMDKAKLQESKSTLKAAVLGFFLLSFTAASGTVSAKHTGAVDNVFNEADTFPVPKQYDNLLFYLQRTPNTNTVMYELNIDKKTGQLDGDDPVHVYWIRYTEPGKPKKELNFIQRKYAYGLKVKKISDIHWELRFVSTSKRTLHLKKADDGRYYVFAAVNGVNTVLKRVYLKIDGGTFWSPNVVYIELKGTEAASGKVTVEQIKM